jgi:hypothetical protein
MEKLITENRKCIYRKSVCTFHGFFQRSMVIKPSIMVGGDSGGVIAYPVAIIEDKKGKLMEVEATSIRFVEDKQCF